MLQRQPACLRRSSLVLLVSIIILPSSSTVTRSKTMFVRAPACIKSHLQGITRVRSPRLVLVFIRAQQRTNLNGWGETSDRRPALPFPRYHVRRYQIAHLAVSRLKPPLESFDEFRKQLCRIHFGPYRQHSLTTASRVDCRSFARFGVFQLEAGSAGFPVDSLRLATVLRVSLPTATGQHQYSQSLTADPR